MTILQLQYAVECARRRSLNKAAESLFVLADRAWKNELLKTTDCFSCGIKWPPEGPDSDLVSIPTDLSTCLIMALWVEKGDMYPLAEEYLDCLQEEIGYSKKALEIPGKIG